MGGFIECDLKCCDACTDEGNQHDERYDGTAGNLLGGLLWFLRVDEDERVAFLRRVIGQHFSSYCVSESVGSGLGSCRCSKGRLLERFRLRSENDGLGVGVGQGPIRRVSIGSGASARRYCCEFDPMR